MTNVEEAVLEKLRGLSEEKQRQVLSFVEALEREEAIPESEPSPARDSKARASMQWVREHRSEYLGKWVALDGDRLVACGDDARQAYQEARRQGVTCPFLNRVSEEPEAAWGGWL